MKLSVIILNYNVRYFLQQCIMSVVKALEGIESEIIVVDNNSPDDSCDMVCALFPNVRLIANTENLGFPKANNIGVAAASGDYICILNPDTAVAENTFTKLLAFVEKLHNPGITGVKLIDGTGKFLPESKRGLPTPFTAFTKMSGLYKAFPKTFGKYYATHITSEQTGKVDILVGAFMFLKRQDYLDFGGFDEQFFMYGEDIDLSYRMLQSGKSNHYLHSTSVIHYKGESSVKDARYRQRFSEAMQLFYKKHFSSFSLSNILLK
ncbi:MAG: glycosyltransferase family 2 protein, partial [Chitinophagaceae bacterium]